MKIIKVSCSISFILLACKINAKDTNYFHYHSLVNQAETNFFLHENIDSAIYLYKKAFKEFDFVFAKDCIMAAQIAVYAKRNNNAVLFINKGFEEGITIEILQPIKVFNNFLKDKNIISQLKINYPILHKKYLARINVNMLRKITDAFFIDEINKNWAYNTNNRNISDSININNLYLIDTLTRQIGMPGEKLIGLDNNNLLKDLCYENEDGLYRIQHRDKEKDGYKATGYEKTLIGIYTAKTGEVAQNKVYIILLHHPCTFFYLKNLWEDAIKKGEIHPRDVAALYDWAYGPPGNSGWRTNKLFDCCTIVQKIYPNYFYNCFFAKYYEMQNSKTIGYGNQNVFIPLTDTKETNEMRRAMYMVDYEVDLAKNKYQKEYEFKIRFGEFSQL